MAMTLQQIFDKVCKHLHKQNEQAMGDGGICVYRSSSGKRCAVGCLIKHKDYSKDIEECCIGTHYWNAPDGVVRNTRLLALVKKLTEAGVFAEFPDFSKDAPIEARLLSDLQNVHDHSYVNGFTERVVCDLRKIAEAFNLSTETLDKLTPYEVN